MDQRIDSDVLTYSVLSHSTDVLDENISKGITVLFLHKPRHAYLFEDLALVELPALVVGALPLPVVVHHGHGRRVLPGAHIIHFAKI